MLWYAAMMEGRSELSTQAAQKTAAQVKKEKMQDGAWGPLMQHFSLIPLYDLTRFGRWEEILEQPRPVGDLLYPRGVWHYARGMAFARKHRLDEAAQEWEKLKAIAANPSMKEQRVWAVNTTANLLHIAAEVLAGEIAVTQKDYERAIDHLKKGVRLEDSLIYIEPPDWYYPVRQSLGAVLLEAGRPTDAERVYRDDLRRNPENGWSLFGLARSLREQGRSHEAQQVEKRFEEAWRWADVTLTSSRF
jgi:tetratricopeptide (TPR) repeat protein